MVVLLIGCGGFCGGCMIVGTQVSTAALRLKELKDLQDRALVVIETNEEVRERLGKITSVDIPNSKSEWTPEVASVECSFAITGESGTGVAQVTGKRSAGTLEPTEIVVEFPDGKSVEVPSGDAAP